MRYEEAERRAQEAAVRTGRTQYVGRHGGGDFDFYFTDWSPDAGKLVATITPEQAREALAQVQAKPVRAERFKGTLL